MDHNIPVSYLTAARREIATELAIGMSGTAARRIWVGEMVLYGLGAMHGVLDALLLTGLAAECRVAIRQLQDALRAATAADESITHPETCK